MKTIKEIHDNLTAGTDHENIININGSINLKVRKNQTKPVSVET